MNQEYNFKSELKTFEDEDGNTVERIVFLSEENGIKKAFVINDIRFKDEEDEDGNNVSVDIDPITEDAPSDEMLSFIVADVLKQSVERAKKVIANDSK